MRGIFTNVLNLILFSKGNDIIRKLQSDLKSTKSKLKLKTVLSLQQEKLLDERSSTLEIIQKDLDTAKNSLEKKTSEFEEIEKTCKALQGKLDESKGIIEDNNHGNFEYVDRQLYLFDQ